MGDFQDRAYPRFEVNAVIDVTSEETDDVMLFQQIENISLGGISFTVPDKLEPGSKVEIDINFPETDETISVMGEVVWCREGEPIVVGVKFAEMTTEERDILRRYLNRIKERNEREL